MAAAQLERQAAVLSGPLPPLLVAAERVAATVAQGVHGRRRVGVGESFWQFRRYQPGDPIQRIDWRQTAKAQAVFVRELEWEASQSIWLWRDASAGMGYRSDPKLPTKRERAELLLAALASLLSRAGERVALLGTGQRPSASRFGLARMVDQVVRDQAGPPLPPPVPLPRHAEVVLLGDFLSPLPEIDRTIELLVARGVRGHLLQVLDPAENTLPFAGRVRFAGFANERETLVPRVERIRDRYRERLAAHQEGLATLTRAVGWSFSRHSTDRPATAALLALYAVLGGEGVLGLGSA